MPEFQFIGKPANRVDGLEKVLGTARYIADYQLPGMLIARALRSPLPHARIHDLDLRPALEIPGVIAAILAADFVDFGRFGYPVSDMYMLAHDRVRYVGDAIAAVAAESEEALEAGLAAIRLDLEPLPAVFDPNEALNPEGVIIGETPWSATELPRGNLLVHHRVEGGDPDELLARCDFQVDENYRTMHQEHAYLETEGALAIPWPDGSGVTVYAPCQSPFINRNNLMQALGLNEHQVRVIQPQVGGAFGGKDDLIYQISGQVARLALMTGRPVRMLLPREESMIASYKRDAMQMHIHLGADADGNIRASRVEAVVDSGAYASITPFTAWRSSIHAMGPYRYDACQVDVKAVYTNNGYSGAFRGFGNTEVCAGIEQAVDELACKMKLDPLEFRLKNCLRPGDVTPHGQKLEEDVVLAECISQVHKISDWDQTRAAIELENQLPYRPGSTRRGMGVAVVFHGMSLGAEGADRAVCTLRVCEDGSLELTSGLTDYGTGSRTTFSLIVAETLGLRPERIRMLRPDTDTAVDSGPTVASRATVLGGNAARVAALQLKELLTEVAAHKLGCQPGQVGRNGEEFIGPNEEPINFVGVVDHARQMGILLAARGQWSSPENHWSEAEGHGKPYFAYHYGAQVAEVEVNPATGKVDVRGFWAVHNTGTVIFLQGAIGQLAGGITQGLGYALLERVDFDNGYLQTTNFDEYLIPTSMDVPDIVYRFVEKPFAPGPYGAKNLGEPGMVPAAPAILNAVFHATGKRIRELPANLERVLLGHDLRKTGSDRACKLGLHR